MGGKSSENYIKFKKKCIDAFLYLRKYANFFINLFFLMYDSEIKVSYIIEF